MQNALVLGTFDGLHIGHRAVIKAAEGKNISVITFSRPPKSYFSDDCGMLMTLDDRISALKKSGAERIEILDFLAVKDIAPLDFLNNICEKYNPSLICCGYDYRFGKNANGNISILQDFCNLKGIELKCIEPILNGSKISSSSEIRTLIKNGDIIKANELLFEPFGFKAVVKKGDMRGRTIGFPTFNQQYPKDLVAPKFGVYSSVSIIDGTEYKSITNIGIRPTYRTDDISCETHVPDFSADLYGKSIRLLPQKFLREEKKFNTIDELKAAISNDIKSI